MKKCCICGNPIDNEFGNNPYPVKENGRCCDKCNYKYVIPARMLELYVMGGNESNEKN